MMLGVLKRILEGVLGVLFGWVEERRWGRGRDVENFVGFEFIFYWDYVGFFRLEGDFV